MTATQPNPSGRTPGSAIIRQLGESAKEMAPLHPLAEKLARKMEDLSKTAPEPGRRRA